MTYTLDRVRSIIRLLKDEGVEVVCVGGAARDTYLGRTPKDYDLVILNNVDSIPLTAVLEEIGADSIQRLEASDCESYEAEDRGLRAVYDFAFENIAVQLLLFDEDTTARYKGDPREVVEDHDCELNHAWFEEVGGRLVARVADDFPSPYTGNTNTFRVGFSHADRKQYIAGKFPEFNHK